MRNLQPLPEHDVDQMLSGPVYQAYSYSYPHKTTYRHFESPVSLENIWRQEKLDSLFLYVHIPFCEMRCGFCNLFTFVRPENELIDIYLDGLERQITALKPVILSAAFARYAIGGGTPTYLSTAQLERLFNLTDSLKFNENLPVAIEGSPATISEEKVRLLEERRVTRVSMGVQSFTQAEITTLARRQNSSQVLNAIDVIRRHSGADLNLDLIYGIAGQTVESWLFSLKQALTVQPEELYLYPLYVRDKTGLGKVKDQHRKTTDLPDLDSVALYRAGRDFLLAQGYRQISMRMFRREDLADRAMPTYSCQEDGMLGLGAGARSYTQELHYSSEYAVGRSGVKGIIDHYVEQPTGYFTHAHYGVMLDHNEQKRRYLIQSLLIAEGLSLKNYSNRFGSDCMEDFVQLQRLVDKGLAVNEGTRVVLSEAGLERADSIGPWLASPAMIQRMGEYQLR